MQAILRFFRWLWRVASPSARDGEPIEDAFTPSDADREAMRERGREMIRQAQQHQLRVAQPDDGDDVKPITSFDGDCPRFPGPMY